MTGVQTCALPIYAREGDPTDACLEEGFLDLLDPLGSDDSRDQLHVPRVTRCQGQSEDLSNMKMTIRTHRRFPRSLSPFELTPVRFRGDRVLAPGDAVGGQRTWRVFGWDSGRVRPSGGQEEGEEGGLGQSPPTKTGAPRPVSLSE